MINLFSKLGNLACPSSLEMIKKRVTALLELIWCLYWAIRMRERDYDS